MSFWPASPSTSRGPHYRIAVVLYLLLAILSGFGLLGKLQLVQRIVPVPRPILAALVLAWILLPLAWPLALRFRKVIAPLVLLGIAVSSLLVYPRMQQIQKTAGRGSDQPDCIIVAADGMAHAEWPYRRDLMWSRNPMSCGPGWVLLQTPVIRLAGYRWNLLLLWAASILILRLRLSWNQIAGILTLLGLAVVTWVAASDGTDFLTFGVLFAALFAALQFDTKRRPPPFNVLLLLLLALVIQFRFPVLILPVLFLFRRKTSHVLAVAIAAFCFQLCFLLWKPSTYITDGPLHLFSKLTHLSLFASGRWLAVAEVTFVFAIMLAAGLYLRRRFPTPWLSLAYLLAVIVLPSALDLFAKYKVHGTLLGALGLWEGANWFTACLPLSALLLLSSTGELNLPNAEWPMRRSAPAIQDLA